ncbi:MAG: glucokinase [Caldilineales bacterium]|nr:glucokinase [Caldilineales bacterium]
MILAGDIGGTKTAMAIYERTDVGLSVRAEEEYVSAEFGSLTAIVEDFLAKYPMPIESAGFGVAGPVVDGHAHITNLPWIITSARLAEAVGVERVLLINDLQSVAYAVPHLAKADLHTLHRGEPVLGGPIAVLAPGTGLGEAYLTWDGARYHAFACEGGHADFGPTDAMEIELLRYYILRMDHVSYERFCSGSGLPNIYNFLRDNGYAKEPDWLGKKLLEVSDPTPIIVQAALDPATYCELCSMTLAMFVSILGAEAGNHALKIGATGGVYLGGGIPPRILSWLEHQRFMQAFLQKGRMSNYLIRMPVHVILNPRTGLLGAAYYALDAWVQGR